MPCRSELKPVHKLRTESRRLEAQIALLKSIPGLPSFRATAAKALWQIKKLRQAAGRVRDLDVQSGHLEGHAAEAGAGSMPEEAKQQALADIQVMLSYRAERRVRAAEKLTAEIIARQAKAAATLEKLNKTLEPAARKSLPSAELLAIAEQQFARTRGLKLRKPSADDLHTVRKAAKQARYLAENAGSARAVAAAKRYEHLQELGGEWHDWLDLAAAARKELGKKHGLTAEFQALQDGHLDQFRAELEGFLETQRKSSAQRQPTTAKKEANCVIRSQGSVCG